MSVFRSHRFTALMLLTAVFLLINPTGTFAQGPDSLPTTLEQVETVPLPPSDVVELAQRLKGLVVIPEPPSTPRAWQIGDTATFWVDNLDMDEQFQVQADLRYMNDVVYMWTEKGRTVNEDALRRSADTFAEHTYPAIHAAFGTEPLPGVDGDPRLHILLAGNMGYSTAAYFGSESLFPVEIVDSSNEREMFYVNLDTMANDIGTDYFDGVLAHEFQHMVHWTHDSNEDTWMDEGMAELASLLTGFERESFAPFFLENPAIQLTTWPEVESSLPYYGAAFMFMTYFHERFGDEGTRLLVSNPDNGFLAVDDTLRQLNAIDTLSGQPVTGLDVFADWTVANLLDDPGLADGRYGYTLLADSLGTARVTNAIKSYPAEQTTSAPQYSAHYINLSRTGPGRIRVTFDGAETVRLVPTDAASGSRMWYSNRGDSSDSTLTHAFDLTGAKSATLEFDTWYHLEDQWDYAYVMASTDGGATWALLETPHTTRENPYGNAYGPGYTGTSGGWVHESIDLTPFVGHETLIRFEMITDLAVNTPGIVIDNVAIPEIGYASDFEDGMGGWDSQGWLYIDNVLPQEWIVQVVRRAGDATEVTRLLMPGDGTSGQWDLDLGGPDGQITLIISPIAPKTTEPGNFTLTAETVG